MLGLAAGSLDGRPLSELIENSDSEQLSVLLVGGTASTVVEWHVRHGDGGWRDLEIIAADMRGVAGVDGLVLTMRDITERKQLDAELQRQALHDTLTNLPNRVLFVDRVGHALDRAEQRGNSVGVLFVNLDDFKVVNESLGHAVGDETLVAVAARLSSLGRAGDTVARFGGDEFAVLVESDDPAGIEKFAVLVQTAMQEPISVAHGKRFVQRVSIGIAIGAHDTHDPDHLLRGADVAAYVAKRNGKDRYEVFDPAMYEDARRRLEIAGELEGAIERKELVVYYQPIVDLRTGRTLAAETLVRWQHPRRGLLKPDEFIPTAETNGLVIPLGKWVLAEACAQTKEWKRTGIANDSFYVAVNLSARHLQDPNVVSHVADVLRQSGLAPKSLVLEITETALIEDHIATSATLGALKQLGVRIAVDDFGTGFSSLSYLSTFPLDIIKIDKSFTDQVTVSAEGAAMVRAVVDIAAALKLTTVVEGIEHHAQATALEQLGCGLAQGFLYAKPGTAAEMARTLARPAYAALN
jgi:diguanylate cyclase (GGDEF)-like protein